MRRVFIAALVVMFVAFSFTPAVSAKAKAADDFTITPAGATIPVGSVVTVSTQRGGHWLYAIFVPDDNSTVFQWITYEKTLDFIQLPTGKTGTITFYIDNDLIVNNGFNASTARAVS